MLPYCLLRPALFSLDAETAHELTIAAMKRLGALIPPEREAGTPIDVMGLKFPNRVGLAAGLDKNGEAITAWGRLGFGFVEIGTVTPRAQPGNPRPRLFRLPEKQGIINRMGFNNEGSRAAAVRLAKRPPQGAIVGVNIGKTKVVPDELAVQDYVASAERLALYADYMVVNVSSPNTPGLRDLQAVERLGPLLSAVREALDLVDRLVVPFGHGDDADALLDLLAVDGRPVDRDEGEFGSDERSAGHHEGHGDEHEQELDHRGSAP